MTTLTRATLYSFTALALVAVVAVSEPLGNPRLVQPLRPASQKNKATDARECSRHNRPTLRTSPGTPAPAPAPAPSSPPAASRALLADAIALYSAPSERSGFFQADDAEVSLDISEVGFGPSVNATRHPFPPRPSSPRPRPTSSRCSPDRPCRPLAACPPRGRHPPMMTPLLPRRTSRLRRRANAQLGRRRASTSGGLPSLSPRPRQQRRFRGAASVEVEAAACTRTDAAAAADWDHGCCSAWLKAASLARPRSPRRYARAARPLCYDMIVRRRILINPLRPPHPRSSCPPRKLRIWHTKTAASRGRFQRRQASLYVFARLEWYCSKRRS